MKIYGTLSVFDGEVQPGDTTLGVSVTSFDLLVKMIRDVRGNVGFSSGEAGSGRWFQFEYEMSEKLVRSVFWLIREYEGRVPSNSVVRGLVGGEFYQPLRKIYSNKELDEFQYYTFFPGQFIGTMGTRKSINDPISVQDDFRLRKMLSIGELYPHAAVGIDKKLSNSLIGLQGVCYEAIAIEQSGEFSGIFRLLSNVVLPDCLLEKLNAFGDKYESNEKGCLFDGGPFTVPELVYDRRLFPEFDIALTKEFIGLSENDRFQILVISRDVKMIFKKHGLNRIKYYPVRRNSPDESVFVDPWEAIFAE
jgi:hypothetical protein